MVGFPQFFHVNAGNSVLKHPLYLKYNTKTLLELDDDDMFEQLRKDMLEIMLTNDNMAIIWYLSNVYAFARTAGLKL